MVNCTVVSDISDVVENWNEFNLSLEYLNICAIVTPMAQTIWDLLFCHSSCLCTPYTHWSLLIRESGGVLAAADCHIWWWCQHLWQGQKYDDGSKPCHWGPKRWITGLPHQPRPFSTHVDDEWKILSSQMWWNASVKAQVLQCCCRISLNEMDWLQFTKVNLISTMSTQMVQTCS